VDLWPLYYADSATGRIASGDKTLVYGGAPRPGPGCHAPSFRILANQGYAVGYCDAVGNPVWAADHVRDLARLPTPGARPDKFETDRRTAARVAPGDYAASGYDRGHLAPNYAIAVCHGEAAQRETFLLSNIVPQLHALNAGLWKDLEQRVVRRYVERYGTVWVQVGPVYVAAPARRIGRLPVPDAFWMVVSEYDETARGIRAIAYVIPHEEKWRDPELTRYVVSVRQVEALTGLDFFPKLPPAVQDRLESTAAPRAW
jgi:endonuclease G